MSRAKVLFVLNSERIKEILVESQIERRVELLRKKYSKKVDDEHTRSAVLLSMFLYGIRKTVSSVTSVLMYVLTLVSVRLL